MVLLGKLFFIQVLHHDFYVALAQGQQKFFVNTEGERGEIFFRNGEPLAKNKNWQLVFSSPNEIKNKEETAQILSEILSFGEDSISSTELKILEKLKKDTLYVVIKNKLTEEEALNLKKLNLPGIYLSQNIGRYYPQETLTSQVIGFLSRDGKGQYGLEGYYNEILKGKESLQEGERGAWGNLWGSINKKEDKGADLILTLDYNIQFRAEKLLKQAKENLEIEAGQIIVIDPNSGKILALANFPNFNPNQYDIYAEEGNLEIFKNSVIQKIFEPGSVFKPITMAAALDQEKITPQTTYIDKGQVKVDGWPRPIYNYGEKVHGEQTMTNVLEKSINTGAVFVERQIGHNIFLDYIERFGIFGKTDIDLQGEEYSENREFKKGYEINFATASFGQGIEMTPIQLARAYCAIANGGKLVKPYLVERIIENGKVIETQPEISSQVISRKTAYQLTAMLVSVTERGFAKAAQISGYYIAGKTGTAQIPFEDKRGYYQDRTIQSFVGWAPAFNPQFLILIKFNNPKTKTAEYSAVPIFQELAKDIINYYQIPPDYE